MRIEGVKKFDAPREEVYRALTDPNVLAESMPGVESVEMQDESHWTASVKLPIGIGPAMKISFELMEKRSPEHARLRASGKSFGTAMTVTTEFELAPEGAGTSMHWIAEVELGGILGGVGDRVLEPVARRQTESLLSGVERRTAR